MAKSKTPVKVKDSFDVDVFTQYQVVYSKDGVRKGTRRVWAKSPEEAAKVPHKD